MPEHETEKGVGNDLPERPDGCCAQIVPDPFLTQIDDVAEDFACRWRAGEHPTVEEYATKFPQLADEIRAVLPAVVLMEQLKPRTDEAGTKKPQSSFPERMPERIGEYRIIREIGRGGMGVVYEADQEALSRRVAIKVLPAHLMSDDKLRFRFRREAQAAARLHHTNIVPVFAVGESEGQCYYVMQLIEGRGLDRIIREAATAKINGSPLEPREFCRTAARVGFQIADALAYAHAQGVVHRDIKPSNLLLADKGTVWVTDFGVAKLVESANITQSGDFIGTMKYMPPERFAGQSDARGDIYSLGMTLYELLTSRSAFPDSTPHNLMQLIIQQTPVQPRKLNPDIPKDLETIVRKAAARDAAHRYQTAGELAEDLRRFLNDRPILAKRTGPVEELLRCCRRNPALSAVSAAALLLMVAITIVSVAAYANARAANQEMEKVLASEKAQRDHAENTAALALDALNRTYDRFAPNRLVVAPPTANELGVEIPIQPATLPPEAVPLLEELLRTYEQVARSGGEFPKLRPQVAEANHRIGDIRRRLGRFPDAALAYQNAIDLYVLLLPDSDTGAVRIKLARAYNALGRAHRMLQQPDDSRRMHDKAIRTLAEGSKALTDRPECRYELAYSFYSLDDRDMFLKKDGPPPPKKDQPARQAVSLLEGLVAEFPSVPEYRHLLACCYRDLPPGPPGWGPKPGGPPPSFGGGNVDRAVDLLRQLVADFPGVPDYRLDLCETLGRPGPRGRPGEFGKKSDGPLQEAIHRSAELVAQYPNVPDYTAAHARYVDRHGMDLFRDGKLEEAEKQGRRAVALQSKLVKQYPEVVAYDLWLGLMERSLGETLGARGQLREARSLLEDSTRRVEELWKKDPRLGGARPFLNMAYHNLAHVLEQSGELALANAAHRKAAEHEPRGKGPFGPKGRS